MIIQLLLVKKEIQFRKILKLIFKYAIAAIIMTVILIVIPFEWVESVILRIGLTVIIGGIVYIIMLVLLKESFVTQCWQKILYKAGKGKNK